MALAFRRATGGICGQELQRIQIKNVANILIHSWLRSDIQGEARNEVVSKIAEVAAWSTQELFMHFFARHGGAKWAFLKLSQAILGVFGRYLARSERRFRCDLRPL